MKVLDETATPFAPAGPPALALNFAAGIVGFPAHRRGEVFHIAVQLPFHWLRLHGPDPLHFVVIDPAGLVPGYNPELFDEDATALGIVTAADALVLNIVTVLGSDHATATANLVGPVIINRHTGAARQVVIANHAQYNARHPLVAAS